MSRSTEVTELPTCLPDRAIIDSPEIAPGCPVTGWLVPATPRETLT